MVLYLKRLYPEAPIVGVGAVILRKGKILLEKRKNEPGKDLWSVPGGKVELGENAEQAVIREVKEETGLTVINPKLIDVLNNIVRDEDRKVRYHFVIIDFLVQLKHGTAKPGSDAADLKWVRLDHVQDYSLTETFRIFLTRNIDQLKHFKSC